MTLYETLGVDKKASGVEVKKAYHAKAKALHPDVNPGEEATEEMAKVNLAYRVLKNKTLRDQYDRTGVIPGDTAALSKEEMLRRDMYVFFGDNVTSYVKQRLDSNEAFVKNAVVELRKQIKKELKSLKETKELFTKRAKGVEKFSSQFVFKPKDEEDEVFEKGDSNVIANILSTLHTSLLTEIEKMDERKAVLTAARKELSHYRFKVDKTVEIIKPEEDEEEANMAEMLKRMFGGG